MKSLTVFSFFIFILISSGLSIFFSIKNEIFVSNFLISFVGILNLIYRLNSNSDEEFKIDIFGLLLFLTLLLIKVLLDQSNQLTSLFVLVLIPILNSINLRLLDKNSKHIIFVGVLVFFLLECTIAIYEKYTGSFILRKEFESINQLIEMEKYQFRSNSLLGHPLNNGLCVSVIMSAIFLSRIRLNFKFMLLTIGFISLICFDARASLIIWVVIFIHQIIKSYRFSLKLFNFIFLFFLLLYVIKYFNLFGRFFNHTIFDGSALARLSVLSAFDILNGYSLWFGDGEQYLKITEYIGAAGIENSYIVLIVNFGLIGASLIFIFFWHFFSNMLRNLNPYSKFILISAYIILGSTNNGLLNPIPLVLFQTCIACFPFSKKNKI